MPQNNAVSLWNAVSAAGNSSACVLFGAEANRTLSDLTEGLAAMATSRGRTMLSATTSQRAAALALIEFDGVARRIILYPPDLPLGNLPHNIETLRWIASCPMGNLLNWARHRRGSLTAPQCANCYCPRALQGDLLLLCREARPSHKVPAALVVSPISISFWPCWR